MPSQSPTSVTGPQCEYARVGKGGLDLVRGVIQQDGDAFVDTNREL